MTVTTPFFIQSTERVPHVDFLWNIQKLRHENIFAIKNIHNKDIFSFNTSRKDSKTICFFFCIRVNFPFIDIWFFPDVMPWEGVRKNCTSVKKYLKCKILVRLFKINTYMLQLLSFTLIEANKQTNTIYFVTKYNFEKLLKLEM